MMASCLSPKALVQIEHKLNLNFICRVRFSVTNLKATFTPLPDTAAAATVTNKQIYKTKSMKQNSYTQ